MHHTDPAPWRHSHNYAIDSSAAERRTRIVIGITATMMVVEIVGGIVFHSMAVRRICSRTELVMT
jgi:Co/Zn/Cd efflux system component